MNIISLNSFYDCTNYRFFGSNGENDLRQGMMLLSEEIAQDIAAVVGYWPRSLDKKLNFTLSFSDELIVKETNGKKVSELTAEVSAVVSKIESREEYPTALVERLNRIKNDLLELGDENEDNPDTSKDIEQKYNSLNDKIEEIIRITDAANLFNNSDIEASDIYEIKRLIREIRSREHSYIVTGDYKNNKITLYLKGICEFAHKKSLSENSVFISVFAHEIFKLCHQECIRNAGNVWDARMQGMKVISESCASFYTWLFAANCLGDSSLADTIRRGWRSHDYDAWTSSGARYIERYDNWSHDLLKKIFIDSLCNWADAYRDLIACERLGHNLPIK